MSSGLDLERATRIAEEYLERLNSNSEFQVILHREQTMECEFGWVFFWGPSDPLLLVAGNAPLIVDRKDGLIHETGTAYPAEQYIESYARVGRTYPFALPEHLVILEGWKPGLLKISLTKIIRSSTGRGLADAKNCTDEVLAGRSVTLTFPTATDADGFCADAQRLGALARRDTRYH
jgi:hypothetical protein